LTISILICYYIVMTQDRLAQIESRFRDVKGDLITISGWEGLMQYAHSRPDYAVIDDLFTAKTEDIIRKRVETANESGDEIDIGNFGPRLQRLAACLLEISNVAHGGAARISAPIQSLEIGDYFDPHIDTDGGDTILGNFDVVGAPYYQLWLNHSESLTMFEDAAGEQYHAPFDDNSIIVPIRSRQGLLLNGQATEVIHVQDGSSHKSTIPHEAVMEEGDERILAIIYA
jgi:hypothetical protein